MTNFEILNLIGFAFTLAGTIFGIIQFFRNKKLKKYTLSVLQSASGDLCKVQQSTEWTFNNIRRIQELVSNMYESELRGKLTKITSDAQGDAASADRLVINLFSHLMIIQEMQFNTREIIHPEKNELTLWKKELSTHNNS